MSVRNICSVLQIWRWANFYVKIRYKYGMNVKRMAGSYCCCNTVCFLPAALTLQTNCHAVETASVPVESVFAKRWVNRITILKCWLETEQNNHFEMLVRKKKTAFDLDEGKRLGSNIMDTIRLVFADAVIASCLGARKKVLWGLVPVQWFLMSWR